MRFSKRSNRRRAKSTTLSGTRIPWPVPLLMGAAGAFFFWIEAKQLHLPGATSDRLIWAVDRALHTPEFLNIAALAVLALGIVTAWFSNKAAKARGRLLQRMRGVEDLRSMSWQQFERLVGECFKRQGYSVREIGQGGADGGIDLLLARGAEKVLVQCKQWRNSSVGAPVVREMLGLMTHHQATRVKIVCCGEFTKQAREFAAGKPFDLINGSQLYAMIQKVQSP